MELGKYSMGIGDRFARQGRAQLRAFVQAAAQGLAVTPVWNKSHREHTIVGTSPDDVRGEADAAVSALGWRQPYRVDADHIGLKNVELFLASSDFFTLDVADEIGCPAPEDDIRDFAAKHVRFVREGSLRELGPWAETVTEASIAAAARKFLGAVREAGRIYRCIASAKGEGAFITEVSMDETDEPQNPVEMFFILAAVAEEGIPAQTVAPKFPGRFNKGVDYAGDVGAFHEHFHRTVAVVEAAKREFGLPPDLKISVHSGSDKFALYDAMRDALRAYGVGLHLKTAGTTWLEEVAGLAAAGGEGLTIAREIYRESLARIDEMCGPYATVIDIDRGQLPSVEVVGGWSGGEFASALRHDMSCPAYNPHLRQLLHVAYKVAAEMGPRFLSTLDACEEVVGAAVTKNILDRHLRRVFPVEHGDRPLK